MDAIALCRDNLRAQAVMAKQKFADGEAIGVLLAERAYEVDQNLIRLWCHFGLDQESAALVAVGGYGRGELHPHSDVDLLVLTPEQPSLRLEEKLTRLLTALWDAKLEIGHSVRSVSETLRQAGDDITIATNLLESRLLVGSQALYGALQEAILLPDFWPSAPFFEAKLTEQQARHKKASAFDLEPNLKSCPGGLRDIQTISWVAMRHFNASCLAELVSHDFLTPEELEELNACRDYLWRLRFALHCVAERAEDRLLFDHQRTVASLMGYEDGTQLAVEQMMKRYYRTVRAVRELNQMLLWLFRSTLRQRALPPPHALDAHFQTRGRLIQAAHDDVFEQPEQILSLFVHIAGQREVDTVSADTLRLLRKARRKQKQSLSELPACRQQFMAILKHPEGIKALSMMHHHGILGTYLKPWLRIVGQMQFDLFHAFTVDEHTHRLLQFIERFSDPEHKEIFPLGSVLIDQLPKKGLLVLAALFHDIGKGRGGDHSEIGAEEARRFCQEHGINEHDGRLVAWLVEQHLLMSVTAQRRDITDPEVIETFAQQVQDADRLSYLYCLTVADICATNNSLWNNWKGSLLRELYHATRERLNAGMAKPVDSRARIREHKGKARNQLIRQGLEPEAIDAFWQRLSADYFLRFTPAQIQWHSEVLLNSDPQGYQVQISTHVTRGGSELLVYGPDRPGFFAMVMAYLDNKRVSVHDAQIFTTRDGYALDSLVILEHDGNPIRDPSRINSIRTGLIATLTKGGAAASPLRPLSRRMRSFRVPTRVQFLSSQRKQRTMMELVTLDRPGLLAQIAKVFDQCGLSIQAAKITTVGEKAEDFFMLSTPDGEALTQEQQDTLSRALVGALEQEQP
ncbi:[protein-PII] uridylyltransferase [Ferrimonas balearica]|uniref:[protein-PII] uridylyltransferase n=1 Tax=Ferrimonas balearica TaxID=44012 RepID=UPI00396581B6